jgi:hypothetical protein
VIDVADLHTDSDLPLSVFRVIRRYAANWPAIPVVLAGPTPAMAERLRRTGLPVCTTVVEAVAAAEGPPAVARADRTFVPGKGAPSEARALIGDVCRAWRIPEALDSALVVLSEMVTNAIVHASGLVHVTAVLRRPHLHLVVRDHSTEPPRRAPTLGPSLSLSGRGLPLLDAMCTSWGYLSNDTGKAVWARVRVHESTA